MSANKARLHAKNQIASYSLPKGSYSQKDTVKSLFGSNVFDLRVMKKTLSKPTLKAVEEALSNGTPLSAAGSDGVARAMKDWAISHGATHFGHIFYPLTGRTAEKNDSFYNPDRKGGMIADFSGDDLIIQEPDGSSFPAPGIRATHLARGYTIWDMTSPAYIVDNPNGRTLTVPAIFVSWTGEATDWKTPLLRSTEVVAKQAARVLKCFGHKKIANITTSAGAEQEYFLIDRNFYNARPDLVLAGRTLFGASSAKGQEFDDHYFGAINQRVQACMYEFERELYKLGVPVKTRHNEVAPGQYEVAPVYESSNVASDHQQIVMLVIQRVATMYGFACLLHEKPFAGINGSGKHVNMSMGNSTQGNLLEPGDTPHDNAQFLIFCAAFIRGVHKYSGLLRASIASASNDHRLGANEAPPAILSVYMGEQLQNVFDQIRESGKAKSSMKKGTLKLGVDSIPSLPKHAGDRNRTSPFAFTGNKFEFRAVGSNQSIAEPVLVMNAIMAESLDYIANRLEKTKNLNTGVQRIVRDIINEHGSVIFNGDGYSSEWHSEAKKRGLPNLRTTPDALPVYHSKEAIDLFTKYGVLSERELHMVYEVKVEQYNMTINVESNLVVDIAKTQILPAALRHQGVVADSLAKLKAAGVAGDKRGLTKLTKLIRALVDTVDALEKQKAVHKRTPLLEAKHCATKVLPAMLKVRNVADQLEAIVDDELWPLPKYAEMLFLR